MTVHGSRQGNKTSVVNIVSRRLSVWRPFDGTRTMSRREDDAVVATRWRAECVCRTSRERLVPKRIEENVSGAERPTGEAAMGPTRERGGGRRTRRT